SAVFFFSQLLRCFSAEARAISTFIFSMARETSSVTCEIFSLTFDGTVSDFEIASVKVTTLPMTFRFVPQERQCCCPSADSRPHWGQNMEPSRLSAEFASEPKWEQS